MPPVNVFDLPHHLSERILPLGAEREHAGGEFVLYWAHHALRADENPALDTAANATIRTAAIVSSWNPRATSPLS